MLSALAHGNADPAVLPAAAQALSAVETDMAELYCALLSNHLRAPVRRALEAQVMDLEKYRDPILGTAGTSCFSLPTRPRPRCQMPRL